MTAALACVLAAAALALAPRGRRHARIAAIACAIVAASALVVVEIAFGLDAYASPGKWIEGFDVIALLAVGLAVLLRGTENFQAAAAIGIGLIAVSAGLLNGAVFLHPIALAILPGTIMRVLVVAAIDAGTIAIAFGARWYVDTAPAPDLRPDPDSTTHAWISAEPPTPKSSRL